MVQGTAESSKPLPSLMRVLLGVVETAVLGPSTAIGGTGGASGGKHVHIPARATAAAILLVLVTRVHGNSTLETTFSARDVIRCVELFLQLLREKDSALVQDLSCAGLCQLYAVAKQRDEPSLTIGTLERLPNHVKSLSEQIAFEVMATLCREKRLNAPAGVSHSPLLRCPLLYSPFLAYDMPLVIFLVTYLSLSNTLILSLSSLSSSTINNNSQPTMSNN